MALPTRTVSTVLFAAVVLGCGRSQRRQEVRRDDTATTSNAGPLLPFAADIDNTPRSSDRFTVHQKGGRRNDSLDQRKMEAADGVLERVKPRLRGATPEQLIAGLRSGQSSNEVEYYVWREGNKLIEEELARRGAAARDALQRHAEDPRDVWTGAGGPRETVGLLCTRLLEQLDGGGCGGAI